MSTQLPRLESTVGAQEHMTTMPHASIQELSDDMIFRTTYPTLGDYIDAFDECMPAPGERIVRRIDAFEERMLELFKQVLAALDTRLPPAQ